MASVEDYAEVFSLLDSDRCPLIDLMDNFDSNFSSSPCSRFRICPFLSILILQDKKLRSSQCVVALCILHHAYSCRHSCGDTRQSSEDPFISFLIEAVCDEAAPKYVRALALQLLGASAFVSVSASASAYDASKDVCLVSPLLSVLLTKPSFMQVFKQCAAEYIARFTSTSHAFPSREQLQERYNYEVATFPYDHINRDSFFKNAIPDPDVPPQFDAIPLEFDLRTESEPEFDETAVRLLQHLSSEVIESRLKEWIHSFSMCADTSIRDAVRDLIALALKEKLDDDQPRVIASL